MLRGTEKWVTYFVLFIVFIFGVVLLARQIGVTNDLKHAMTQARQSGLYSGDLKSIVGLHNAASKVFFLTFFALCLMVVGIVIIVRSTERAYNIAEVKEKVRHHLKGTTPGVVLVVLASFLLSFCSFRASHIETIYSSRLIDYNNFKIASQTNLVQPPSNPVVVDTSSLKELKQKASNAIIAFKDKLSSKEKTKKESGKEQHKPLPETTKQQPATVASPKKPATVAHKQIAERKQTQKVKVPKPVVASNNTPGKVQKPKVNIAASSSKKPDVKAEKPSAQPEAPLRTITRADLAWAENFQRNVTIYGYVPTVTEQKRFAQIVHFNNASGTNMLNGELTWAYRFLEKTKKGYEPKPGEMQRYEDIIRRSLKSSAAVRRERSEL